MLLTITFLKKKNGYTNDYEKQTTSAHATAISCNFPFLLPSPAPTCIAKQTLSCLRPAQDYFANKWNVVIDLRYRTQSHNVFCPAKGKQQQLQICVAQQQDRRRGLFLPSAGDNLTDVVLKTS